MAQADDELDETMKIMLRNRTEKVQEKVDCALAIQDFSCPFLLSFR